MEVCVMPWGKMDDKFHRNRKVRQLRKLGAKGREALGVWTFWWSWCLDDGGDFDGFVPADELDAAEARCAALLVQVGLWDKAEDGFRFHDFNEYNPTRVQLEHKRESDRDRQRRRRESHGVSRRDTEASRGGVAAESLPARASPSRPDPTQPVDTARDATPEPPALWAAIAEHHAQRSGLLAASSADTRAAHAIADVLGERWLDAYGRWEADPWVREKRPPLRHLADHAAKYALPAEPVAKPTDRYAGWTTFGADEDGAVEATT